MLCFLTVSGAAIGCGTLPNDSIGAKIPTLPDPFHFINGSRVTNKAEWSCRQNQISELLQTYELGPKPPAPADCSASLQKSKVVIDCAVAKKHTSFDVAISYPESGQAPYPALIAIGSSSIPQPAGVALITIDQDDLALQNNNQSRGVGKFYQLYGHDNSAGAMVAWAWGVSRLIDALEKIPAKESRIDTSRLGVTGCSRNGKGALVAGALEERIALTIPQESGSGGAACWRLSDKMLSDGERTQTASEIVTENVWLSPAFDRFANTTVDVLPFDHHMLAGLVAPRGLIIIDNSSQEWLGPWSCYGCMTAARKVWEALGVQDKIGYSMVGNHDHCHFPTSQQKDLDAFVDKFLFGKNVDTQIWKSDLKEEFNASQWIKWDAPRL